MAHDAFISYSSKDKPTADAVCATLEANGVRCWVAPRDVLPGANWAGSIVEAIHSSKVLVLVFSANSNTSTQVMNEIERAVNAGIPILPFRIENIVPSDAMGYFLGSRHWLDALTPPLEAHLQQLSGTVRVILDHPSQPSSTSGPASGPESRAAPAFFPPGPAARPAPAGAAALLRTPFTWAGLVVVLVVAAALAVLALRSRPASATPVQLYNALLSSPLSQSALPSGYANPQAPYAVTDAMAPNDRAARALGQVQLEVTGPDWHDATGFVVFGSEGDARAGFEKFDGSVTPSGFTTPAKCGSGKATLDDLAYGFTRCAALSGNVYVMSQSILLGDDQKQGDPANATTLLHVGLNQLASVRAHPPRPLSATAPPQPLPSPSPLAQLPPTIKIVGEDPGGQAKVGDADLALRGILAGYENSLGVTENRPWTLHLYTVESAARQEMAKLGDDQAFIDSFFQDKNQSHNVTGSGALDSVIYLPNVDDFRGDLAYLSVDYALQNNGAYDKEDVYPWWFITGLEVYEHARYTQIGFGYHTAAVATAKSGLAPALTSISTYIGAGQFVLSQPDAPQLLGARGAAALWYISGRHGEAALGTLLKGNALGSIDKFNELLRSITGLSIFDLDNALTASLRGGTGSGTAPTATAVASAACPGWAGSWDTTFGPMQIVVSGSTVTGTYTYQGGQGRLNGTIAGNIISGAWAEPPTYQPPQHGGDFQFTLSADAHSFAGQWRYGDTGDFHTDWTGRCTGRP